MPYPERRYCRIASRNMGKAGVIAPPRPHDNATGAFAQITSERKACAERSLDTIMPFRTMDLGGVCSRVTDDSGLLHNRCFS